MLDLREPHECTDNCMTAIVDSSRLQIGHHSLSISAIRPEYLAIGGMEPVVRIYDRRMLSVGSAEANFARTAKCWTPAHDDSDMITAVKFSDDSMELVASFINENIYMVNAFEPFPLDRTLARSGLETHVAFAVELEHYTQAMQLMAVRSYDEAIKHWNVLIRRHRRYMQVLEWKHVIALEFLNWALCTMSRGNTTDYASAEKDLRISLKLLPVDDPLEELAATLLAVCQCIGGLHSQAAAAVAKYAPLEGSVLAQMRHVLINGRGADEGSRAPSIEAVKFFVVQIAPVDIRQHVFFAALARQDPTVVGEHGTYSGHINVQTVKDATFAGPRSEYVMSGSDNGYFFIWDRSSAQPVSLCVACDY